MEWPLPSEIDKKPIPAVPQPLLPRVLELEAEANGGAGELDPIKLYYSEVNLIWDDITSEIEQDNLARVAVFRAAMAGRVDRKNAVESYTRMRREEPEDEEEGLPPEPPEDPFVAGYHYSKEEVDQISKEEFQREEEEREAKMAEEKIRAGQTTTTTTQTTTTTDTSSSTTESETKSEEEEQPGIPAEGEEDFRLEGEKPTNTIAEDLPIQPSDELPVSTETLSSVQPILDQVQFKPYMMVEYKTG